uniref:IRS-type PTB domain-containing protein n=1 Tax=Elaeophora elaphi TaxID=1147741 RepID=A0A0R3RPW1_9BILA
MYLNEMTDIQTVKEMISATPPLNGPLTIFNRLRENIQFFFTIGGKYGEFTVSIAERRKKGNGRFTSMAGYHSLDRKTQLLNYYRMSDDNPHRLAAVGQETSAATLAMVSPRHVASSRHQFTLAQQNMEHTLANRHSVAARRTASLSSAGMSRSMVLVTGSGSDSSCGSSQPSTPDNTPNYRSRSPLMTNQKMVIKNIPLSIAAEIPPIERNSTSRRTVISVNIIIRTDRWVYREGHCR